MYTRAVSRLKIFGGHLSDGQSAIWKRPVQAYHKEEVADKANTYKYIRVSQVGKDRNIGLITLHRPRAMNALSSGLTEEVRTALNLMDNDQMIACVVITGSEKVFSAGADIKEMGNISAAPGDLRKQRIWDDISAVRKPIIAAVNGYCLGGGCEIAMACDVIYAGEGALFGQPEISIGTIPGGGGTQRLPRAVGKSKAMEMILSGEPITAQAALQFGLVSDVFPSNKLLERTIERVEKIVRHSQLIVSMAKDSTKKADELPLAAGLEYEQKVFLSTFATSDRLEGMMAFIEKRKPNYTNE